jgi:hypothetical protein
MQLIPPTPLTDLATCFIGFPMEQASKATHNKVHLLQPAHLHPCPIPSELPQAVIANPPPEQILQANDIILAQSPSPTDCDDPDPAPAIPRWHAQVLPNVPPNTVCAAPLLVLRIHDPKRLNPHWLCRYLHTRPCQHLLRPYRDPCDAHEGALSFLTALTLPVPTPEQQQQLCHLATKFAAAEQQAYNLLVRLRRNNDAIWLWQAQQFEMA